MRKIVIAGNWKMYKTSDEALSFVESLPTSVKNEKRLEMVICAPFISLESINRAIRDTHIKTGAQNMYWEKEGAYTGEISGEMLRSSGCSYVIIGHSERRQYFGENDISVNLKVKKAMEIGLRPIMCVGETLEERESGNTDLIIARQMEMGLKGLNLNVGSAENFIVAYEPVWAIGTGKTCATQEANRVIGLIRNKIANVFSPDIAQRTRILYGGSVKPENIKEIVSATDIDGGLVGGASLKSDSFAALVENSL